MPIKFKFLEIMRKIKTDQWTIRFWFQSNKIPPEAKLVAVKAALDGPSRVYAPIDAERIISGIFDPEDELAAVEVLSNATHCGIVSYYEWP